MYDNIFLLYHPKIICEPQELPLITWLISYVYYKINATCDPIKFNFYKMYLLSSQMDKLGT